MKNSTQLLQDLHNKLQIANYELREINFDEQLLEWETTNAPTLPALIEHIEPYHQLWHIAFTFHQRHDLWFHGTRFYL